MDKTTFSVKDVLEKFVQEMEEISQSQAAVNRNLESNLAEIDRRLADLEITVGMVGVEEATEFEHSSDVINFEQKVQLEKAERDFKKDLQDWHDELEASGTIRTSLPGGGEFIAVPAGKRANEMKEKIAETLGIEPKEDE